MKITSINAVTVRAEPWLKQRFGADHYAQISADTTLKLRSSVKDVARATHGSVPPDVEELTKQFQNPPQGISDSDFVFGYTANDEHVPGSIETDAALKTYISRYPKEWETVQRLLGIARSKTRHACGFIIANRPVHEFIPLMDIGGVTATQYTSSAVEAAGGLKMDFLVVNSLGDIKDALNLIQEGTLPGGRASGDEGLRYPATLVINGRLVPRHRLVPDGNGGFYDIWDLPEDQAVFREISEGKTETVFQFNTPGAIQWLRHFNHWKDEMAGHKAIDSIEAMSAFTALDRPGPLDAYVEGPDGRQHNMLVEYARRARGEEACGSINALSVLFPETYGVLTYQEQLQRAYRELTGCSGSEAEEFRTNVAKKKMDKVLKAYPAFIERASAKVGGEQVAKTIWETFVTWGQYGFNKTMDQSTILSTVDGDQKRIVDFKGGEHVWCVDDHGQKTATEVVALHDHGELMGWELEFDDGYKVVASSHHKFLTELGQTPLHEIIDRDLEVLGGVSMEESSGGHSNGVRPEGAETPEGDAQKGLRDLRGRESGKHSAEDDCAQHSAGTEGSGLGGRSENFVSARHPAAASGANACLAARASRTDRGDLGIRQKSRQEIEGGGMASIRGDLELAGCTDPLRAQEEAGGLRVPRPQNLGGSGRILPLSRGIENSETVDEDSGEVRDAARRSASSRRCDIDPAFRAMLPFFRREDASRMARVAYSDAPLSCSRSLVRRRIVRVRAVGIRRMYDLEVAHPKHNFMLSNGVVTSNSHSVCYSHIAYACAYLKHHFPLEWWCAVLGNASKNEVVDDFWRHCGHLVKLPDINRSSRKFRIEGDHIRAPVGLIVGVGETAQQQLLALAPFVDVRDFCQKIEVDCVARKTPLIDKATGKQKTTKDGQLRWTKGRSALTRGVVHLLIAAGVMDSLFPADSTLSEKIAAYEQASAEAKGEKKIQPVPPKYLVNSRVLNFQLRKKVLPIYSEALYPLLLEADEEQWPRKALTHARQPIFRHMADDIPVVSHRRLQALETITPWPADMKIKVAVPCVVKGRRVFSYAKGEKEACELDLDCEGGGAVNVVKWPDRKTGKIPAWYRSDIAGAIGLAIFEKYTERRPFGLVDLIVFHQPATTETENEQEAQQDAAERTPDAA